MGTREYQLLGGGLITLAGLVMVLFIVLPAPRWVEGEGQQGRKRLRLAGGDVWVMGALTAVVGFILWLALDLVPIPAFMIGLVVANLILSQVKANRRQKQELLAQSEATSIIEYVSGRLNANATLFDALQSTLLAHQNETLHLPISFPFLRGAIGRIKGGEVVAEALTAVADGLQGDVSTLTLELLWRQLALLAGAPLESEEARVQYAEVIAHNIQKNGSLQTEKSRKLRASASARLLVTLIIGGFIIYLALFGGSLSETLTQTLPGNILIMVSMGLLWLAQIVGERIGQLPPVRL